MHQISRVFVLCAVLAPGTRVHGQNLLSNPETVVYDSAHHRYLVSNMSSGDIVAIDEYGSYSVLFDELQGAYGMAIAGNTLYVSSYQGPTSGIVGIDLDEPAIVFHRPTTTYGENGITTDTSGNVYFADTGGNCIRRIRVSDGQSSNLASLSAPNAVFFDARHNRLLATSNVWWTPVYAISLPAGMVTAVTTNTGQFSGLAEDALHNLYVAFFNHNQIYRLDSTLQGSPSPWLTGLNGPEGIFFNKTHSTLVVPNLLGNSVDFFPVDADIWMTCDAPSGWAPREVSFSGYSVFDIDHWVWDFGDGDSAYIQSPTHLYDTAGLYDVTVMAVTTGEDTLRRVYPNRLQNLGDTVWAEVAIVDDPASYTLVHVTVAARNNAPLERLIIPMEYAGDLPLFYDSYSVVGCRSDAFDVVSRIDSDSHSKRMTFELIPRSYGSPLYLSPGRGPLLTVNFYVMDESNSQATTISLDGYGASHEPLFVNPVLIYRPVSVGVTVVLPCCSGRVGDANGEGGDEPTIGDVSALIDAKFITGTCDGVLDCLFEADVNKSGGAGPTCDDITIGDIMILIDYLFITGESMDLPDCP